jgi:cyclopropane fatty-acyl-phospholipid synthase-like methyltransferase
LDLQRILQSRLLPIDLLRLGVRISIQVRLRRQYRKGVERQNTQKRALIRKFKRSPIAIHTHDANLQHYEVPTAFFQNVLGKRMKYSCCYWPAQVTSLDQAEEAMLRLTCERARVQDGLRILDLGCGWGSLTLWIAEQYPQCEVMAVSNSRTQVAHILSEAARLGVKNVRAQTADVAKWTPDERFDRVLSIEMFEHMKNYEALMARIATWLEKDGLLFVHHFSHTQFAYEFDAANPVDWMARTFFAGGTMPSHDLLLYFQNDLNVVSHWAVSGLHYARTLRAWWDRMHANYKEIMHLLEGNYGAGSARERYRNWELFFLMTEETFRLRRGEEYLVTHLLFEKL